AARALEPVARYGRAERGCASRMARLALRALHPEGAALRGGVRAAPLRRARPRAPRARVGPRALSGRGRRVLLQPLPAAPAHPARLRAAGPRGRDMAG